jgi:hypothetical protein
MKISQAAKNMDILPFLILRFGYSVGWSIFYNFVKRYELMLMTKIFNWIGYKFGFSDGAFFF